LLTKVKVEGEGEGVEKRFYWFTSHSL